MNPSQSILSDQLLTHVIGWVLVSLLSVIAFILWKVWEMISEKFLIIDNKLERALTADVDGKVRIEKMEANIKDLYEKTTSLFTLIGSLKTEIEVLKRKK